MTIVTDRRDHIRTVFLDRRESYDLREVAQLTESSIHKLRREVADGDRDASKVRGAWRFTWRQLALVAMGRRTLTEIHEALGDDAASALPPLLALRTVTVRLPEYIVQALETVAADGETTVDDALHYELVELAGSMTEPKIEARIPGFRRAYLFPSRE